MSALVRGIGDDVVDAGLLLEFGGRRADVALGHRHPVDPEAFDGRGDRGRGRRQGFRCGS